LWNVGDEPLFAARGEAFEDVEGFPALVAGETEAGKGDEGVPRPLAEPRKARNHAGSVPVEIDQVRVRRVLELLDE